MDRNGTIFQLRFGVDDHEVSVVTAVASLMSVADILKEIGSIVGDEKVEVSIRAPQPGSVLFDIFVASVPVANAALPAVVAAVDYAKTLIDIFDIAKRLKGEKPKTVSVDSSEGATVTQISDVKGNVLIINGDVHLSARLLSSNPTIQRSLKNIGESAKKDGTLKSLAFSYEEADFSIDEDEFDYLEKAGEDASDMRAITDDKAMLTIIRPSFLQNLKSDFYYQGFKISCLIQDGDFYREIDSGKKFSKGDVLECELKIKQKLDATVNTYLNSSYIVTKVVRHHPRTENTKMEI